MVHNFSPYLLQFTDGFGIYWYGLFYLISVLISFGLILWFSNRQQMGFTTELAIDFIGFVGVNFLIFARLGYLIYEPSLLMQFRTEFPYWGALALNDGGLSIHGAMLGALVATFLFSYRSGISQIYLLDLSAVIGAFSIFLGRISNFMGGEYLGRSLYEVHGYGVKFLNSSANEFLIKFPQEILHWPQLYFSKLNALLPVVEKVPSLESETWVHSLLQYQESEQARTQVHSILETILISIQNGNKAALDTLVPLLEMRHPVQIYSALSEGLFIFIFLFVLWFKPRKPGIITSWFLILYSGIRIYVEQFALPEAQIGYHWLGLTQAQIMSAITLTLGLWMLFFYSRRAGLPSLGWGLGQNVRIYRRG